ncbi:MAG TPA: alpha/beta fold hydrolase [Steroidobacteraceae bacterium]|nr:alpha/beta fold hydrolase [Steroidobacteraceae bacterium]
MIPETHRICVSASQAVALDWYPASTAARAAALFVHGLGSNRRGEKALRFADRFNEHGWSFASLDLRGHGESDGRTRDLTVTGMLADVHAARTWIAERGVREPLFLIGTSMGGAVVAWYALQHPEGVSSLALIAPSLQFPRRLAQQIGEAGMREWRSTGTRTWKNQWIDLELGYGIVEDAARYSPETLSEQLAKPTLIIHGMRDEVLDWHDNLTFARQCAFSAVELLLCKDGDHRMTDRKDFLFDVIWAWLDRLTLR